MKARLILRERIVLADDAFVEMVVWDLPQPAPGSTHRFKYRLALIAEGVCILRYDNEAGKGDHKHIGTGEADYRFVDLVRLQADFWADVERWRNGTWVKS